MTAKRIRKSERSRGGVLLARLSIDYATVAQACGVSKPCIAQWVKGNQKPAAPKREILARLYGIPADSWDELAESPSTVEPTAAPDAASIEPLPEGVLGKLATMEAFVSTEMRRIQTAALTPQGEGQGHR